MNVDTKKVSASRTQQIQAVTPQHLNPAGHLFGGQLMAWIDIVAGIVAWRHVGGPCTTASVDSLNFYKAVYPPAILILEGCITFVGTSSMEIRVDTCLECSGEEHVLVNRAYLTFVAINENGKPILAPKLDLETEEEVREWEAGAKRSQLRKQQRAGKRSDA